MHPSILSGLCSLRLTSAAFSQATYPIVDTAQNRAYGERSEISYPKSGDQFYGQDAQYAGALPLLQGQRRWHGVGSRDWRLPTIKELQSIIDYTRSPESTDPDYDPNATPTRSQRQRQ